MKSMVWLTVAALAASCVGTDVGNPPDDRRTVRATLEFSVYEGALGSAASGGESSAEVAPRGLTLWNGTELEAVWMRVARVVVTPAADCSPSAEQDIEGPFVVDLLGGQVIPAPPVLADQETEFCALRLELARDKDVPEGAPPGLSGAALWASGVGPAGTAFTLEIEGPRRIDYVGTEFAVGGGQGAEQRFVAAFGPTDWFAEIELASTVPLVLDEVVAQREIAAFWHAFVTGSRVVPDNDRDGRARPEEFEQPVALPGE